MVILRRFSKNSDFKTLRDTFLITPLTNANFQRMHDTVLVLFSIADGNSSHFPITGDYAYEVYLPQADRLYKITNVVEGFQYGTRGGEKTYCINPITSYALDGRTKQTGNGNQFIYLEK